MLERSDTEIAPVLARFNSRGAEVSLLVPTSTGLKKSIMDATKQVREQLLKAQLHDYGAQSQGQDQKRVLRAFFVYSDRLEETTASLYRPQTKSGDPRIWFRGLKKYAEPYNLLTLIVSDGAIYVINVSRAGVIESLERSGTPLNKLTTRKEDTNNEVAAELLSRLQDIASRGFIRTLRAGDTGVGMTLETLLGIEANCNQAPDYHGIELKAARLRRGNTSRATLFTQAPDWSLSPINSPRELLKTYGYVRNGKQKLNHQITGIKPNSLGFTLKIDSQKQWLKQCHIDASKKIRHVTTWEIEKLRTRLSRKHYETFWVKAQCRGKGKEEEFHYSLVRHTKAPLVRNFEPLIESGAISVDFLMSQQGNGVRSHGYPFKMHEKDIPALFPLVANYELS